MVTVLRPLSTSELLDRTFHLYRNNFLVFVGIMAIPQLVVLALQLGTATLILEGSLAGLGAAALLVGMAIGLASYLAVEISHAATIMAVSNLHLDRPASIGSAFSSARSSMLRVIGISIAIAIAVGIALIFLIVPGIYLALAWSLAIPVTVLEGGGLNTSVTRSKALTKGSRWRILLIYLLIIVLSFVVSAVLQFGLLLSIRLFGVHDRTTILAITHAMQSMGSFLSASLVGPLGTIALTLIYYDLRVRKEGFDLQLMMATLQPNPQAAAASIT